MLRTRMTTLAFILTELFPLDCFRCNFLSAPQLEYPLECNHDSSQLCRTGHDDVLRTRMTILTFILTELFPLDCFRCNFLSAPQLEYPLECNHDSSQLCRTGHDDVLRTRMTILTFILTELFPLDCFRCNLVSAP